MLSLGLPLISPSGLCGSTGGASCYSDLFQLAVEPSASIFF